MRELPITQGKVVLVDDADYEWLVGFRWYALRGSRTDSGLWYARARVEGRWQCTMHRLIIPAPMWLRVDHIDGNGLNNQRANLRIVTPKGNANNQKHHRAQRQLQPTLWEGLFDENAQTLQCVHPLGNPSP